LSRCNHPGCDNYGCATKNPLPVIQVWALNLQTFDGQCEYQIVVRFLVSLHKLRCPSGGRVHPIASDEGNCQRTSMKATESCPKQGKDKDASDFLTEIIPRCLSTEMHPGKRPGCRSSQASSLRCPAPSCRGRKKAKICHQNPSKAYGVWVRFAGQSLHGGHGGFRWAARQSRFEDFLLLPLRALPAALFTLAFWV
jgi:hypothetical protein